jgi:hypothetical protein
MIHDPTTAGRFCLLTADCLPMSLEELRILAR